ncbi:MAG: hypothetical protein JRC77_06805, partial [Deltaproteobacteria bacterium]|nr:hypothetical protein [Deltaproteobacteria bacterium]
MKGFDAIFVARLRRGQARLESPGLLRFPDPKRVLLWSFLFRLVLPTTLQAAEFDPQQGLRLKTDSAQLHLGGRFALDGRYYDSTNRRDSEIDSGVLDVWLEGRFQEEMTFRVVADLKGLDTDYGLREAWASIDLAEQCRLTVGVIPISIGVESSFEKADYSFTSFGFPAYLDSRTDIGLKFEGEVKEGLFSYVIDLAAGEGFDQNGDKRKDPQISTRLVSYPLRGFDFVSGLFISLGASYSSDY